MDKAAISQEMVHEFVRVAHGDLARVQALLAQEPGLVNASWDWGGGDWETALGAAAHTGQVAIAAHLLAHGARMDIFCAVMMGKIEIVKAYLADNPGVAQARGPHGISLKQHAIVGQQEAILELLGV
ncbi:MAG: hypothetical protein KC418_16695 [Anaerolineales bacterium]|nr:hypothetical protein [Anaerolineales bacterium]